MYSIYVYYVHMYVSFNGTTCAYAQRIYVLSSWWGSSRRAAAATATAQEHIPYVVAWPSAFCPTHIQTLYIFLNLVIKNKYIYVFVQWHTFVCIYTRCRFSIYIIKESIKKTYTKKINLRCAVHGCAAHLQKIIIMKTHVLCCAQIECAGCATRRDGELVRTTKRKLLFYEPTNEFWYFNLIQSVKAILITRSAWAWRRVETILKYANVNTLVHVRVNSIYIPLLLYGMCLVISF